MRLYDLADGIAQVLDRIDEAEGEVTPELAHDLGRDGALLLGRSRWLRHGFPSALRAISARPAGTRTAWSTSGS